MPMYSLRDDEYEPLRTKTSIYHVSLHLGLSSLIFSPRTRLITFVRRDGLCPTSHHSALARKLPSSAVVLLVWPLRISSTVSTSKVPVQGMLEEADLWLPTAQSQIHRTLCLFLHLYAFSVLYFVSVLTIVLFVSN